MKKEFYLTITGTEYGEWQGTLRRANGRQTSFQSVLELLRVLDDDVSKPTEQPCENGREVT